MWLFNAVATFLWSSGILLPTPLNPKHTVSTTYATFSGNFTPPYSLAFLGVPYAEPPVGHLRFRAPAPLDTSKFDKSVIIDASSYPDFCVQGVFFSRAPGGAGTEDCLKANIYTPFNATESSKLPVLVYFHGGGYVEGNPRNWPFEHWINQSPNVVVVSVYYRLSAFGFLAHPSFSDASNGDSNAGFLDQLEALKWVKKNIAAFGGDPDHVTINGESAGGGSVQMHLVAKESRGLFHGAIAQSVARMSMPTPEQQLPLFHFYAKRAGCVSRSSSEIFKCLREASVDVLAKAQNASPNLTNWRPALDGKIFVDYPTNLLQAGDFAHVPIIAGSTSNETVGAFPFQKLSTTLLRLYPQLTPQDIKGFEHLYDRHQFSSRYAMVKNAVGETLLRCGREILGSAGVCNSKAWTYRYNQPRPSRLSRGAVGHAAENWMMFLGAKTSSNGGGSFTGLDPVQTAFSQELIAYWISFVRSFDPNTYKLERSPEWPGFEEDVRIVLQQDPKQSITRSGIVVEKEPEDEAKRCRFIARHSTSLQV